MGQPLSIQSKFCVMVPEELISEQYTVLRHSGSIDPGWQIAPNDYCHSRVHIKFHSASKHAGIWRIYMNNDQGDRRDPNTHLCGWRRIDTIEPTRLSGSKNLIEAWRMNTIALLEALEKERVEAHGIPVVADDLKEN